MEQSGAEQLLPGALVGPVIFPPGHPAPSDHGPVFLPPIQSSQVCLMSVCPRCVHVHTHAGWGQGCRSGPQAWPWGSCLHAGPEAGTSRISTTRTAPGRQPRAYLADS